MTCPPAVSTFPGNPNAPGNTKQGGPPGLACCHGTSRHCSRTALGRFPTGYRAGRHVEVVIMRMHLAGVIFKSVQDSPGSVLITPTREPVRVFLLRSLLYLHYVLLANIRLGR